MDDRTQQIRAACDLIERRVEKMIDRLDRQYMADNSTLTSEEYRAEMRRIDRWSNQQFDAIERRYRRHG